MPLPHSSIRASRWPVAWPGEHKSVKVKGDWVLLHCADACPAGPAPSHNVRPSCVGLFPTTPLMATSRCPSLAPRWPGPTHRRCSSGWPTGREQAWPWTSTPSMGADGRLEGLVHLHEGWHPVAPQGLPQAEILFHRCFRRGRQGQRCHQHVGIRGC
uniref:Uncharacterized protein n=1 Tax=Chelonoidis abingdonii TaxID=106734 RepID=A0A8C0JA52_CHEAB